MQKLRLLSLVWLLLVACADGGEKWAIFYSGSVQGETEPCG